MEPAPCSSWFQVASRYYVRRARGAGQHGSKACLLGGATSGRREATEACPQTAVEYRQTRGVVQRKSTSFSGRAKTNLRGKAEVRGSGLRQFVEGASHDSLVERPRRIKPLEARPPVSNGLPMAPAAARLS